MPVKSVERSVLGMCCCAKRLKAIMVSFGVIFCTIYFVILTPPTGYEDAIGIQNARFRRNVFQNNEGKGFIQTEFLFNHQIKTYQHVLRVNESDFSSMKGSYVAKGTTVPVAFINTTENMKNSALNTINITAIAFNKTAFGSSYKLNEQRSNNYDFPFIIDGKDVCANGSDPFLVIMVLSVHTHIDTRTAIRKTWGRAADPGLWPKVGALKHTVKLVFLFGTGKTALDNKIVEEESKIYGDIVQAEFVDSYFNLTYKTVMGIRWVAEFCSKAKYILKADEDVFVHVHNLMEFLSKRQENSNGAIYGHALHNSDVFREGRWAVSRKAYPLKVYPTYTCGNTYVISGNMAANIYYTAGLLPYLNIEDVFVTGIVRSFLSAELTDVIGFTHWFEKKPKPCEFKNSIRISATKVQDYMQYSIWEGLKTKEADCYKAIQTKHVKINRPERGPRMTQMIRDEHIFMNKTSGQFYVL